MYKVFSDLFCNICVTSEVFDKHGNFLITRSYSRRVRVDFKCKTDAGSFLASHKKIVVPCVKDLLALTQYFFIFCVKIFFLIIK